jgi:hypothetical protein
VKKTYIYIPQISVAWQTIISKTGALITAPHVIKPHTLSRIFKSYYLAFCTALILYNINSIHWYKEEEKISRCPILIVELTNPILFGKQFPLMISLKTCRKLNNFININNCIYKECPFLWRGADLVWTDILDEHIVSIFWVEKSAGEKPKWAGVYTTSNKWVCFPRKYLISSGCSKITWASGHWVYIESHVSAARSTSSRQAVLWTW